MPSKSLPVHVFGAVLTKISELCSVARTNLVDVVSMIRLSEVLLRNAPEGLNTRFTPHRLLTSRRRNDESDAEAHNKFPPSIPEQTGSVVHEHMHISGNLQVHL